MADFVGAVDQGTTSTRFMIFDHGGNEVARAPARARPDPAAGRLGRAQPRGDLGAHQRGHRDRAAPRRTCRPRTWPRSASPTSARPPWCGTSSTGRPYYNAIVWQDTRTDRIASALERDGRGRCHPAQGRPAPGDLLLRRQDPVAPGERRRAARGRRSGRRRLRQHRQLAACGTSPAASTAACTSPT